MLGSEDWDGVVVKGPWDRHRCGSTDSEHPMLPKSPLLEDDGWFLAMYHDRSSEELSRSDGPDRSSRTPSDAFGGCLSR